MLVQDLTRGVRMKAIRSEMNLKERQSTLMADAIKAAQSVNLGCSNLRNLRLVGEQRD